MKCPKCGLENDTRSVCLKCGNFLNNKVTQRVTDPEVLKQMKTKRRKELGVGCLKSSLLMFLVFVVGTVLIILAGLFLFRNQDIPTEEELAEASRQWASQQAEQEQGTVTEP